MFIRHDIEKLRLIHHLVKEKGFTLEGCHLKLKKERNLTDSTDELIPALYPVIADRDPGLAVDLYSFILLSQSIQLNEK